MCPMMKVILQNLFFWRNSLSSEWWPEKLFVISNFPLAFENKNSTRNKKLSVRLSESITLFSFLSHLSDLFGPFFILSSFFFLFKSRSYQIFILFFLPLTPHSHIYSHTKGRRMISKRRENQNYDHDFTLFFERSTKELWRHNSPFISAFRENDQKEMTIRNHACTTNQERYDWNSRNNHSFQLFILLYYPTMLKLMVWECWEVLRNFGVWDLFE